MKAQHDAMHATARLTHFWNWPKGPALRAALVEEVAELLTVWPADCPHDMRAPARLCWRGRQGRG